MKLPASDWQARPGMAGLLAALDAATGETRYVGGCVRDTLLGLPVSDIDLATRLAPQDVIGRLREAAIKAVPTGLAHGTITAVLPHGVVEITTLRRDISTDGRRATIAYTNDWAEDAARRDFTINALSADLAGGEIFDYFGGLADLDQRSLRFIGDPLQRIAEDHLRILRFFRFHARFGAGEPDNAALSACAARANDLMALSRERIADELIKLLGLPDPTLTVRLMIEHGILRPVLPEIESAEPLAALVQTERAAQVEPDALRRLAALLPADPGLAASIAGRLRLSRHALKRLVSATHADAATSPKILAYQIGTREAVDRLLLAGDAQGAAALADWTPPKFSIGGGELIAMGLKPGPPVAATLREIQREWAQSGFTEDAEAQRLLARAHVDQALRASQ